MKQWKSHEEPPVCQQAAGVNSGQGATLVRPCQLSVQFNKPAVRLMSSSLSGNDIIRTSASVSRSHSHCESPDVIPSTDNLM